MGALLASVAVVIVAGDSPVAADPSSGFLDDLPSTTPENLGDIDLTDLQYGDPSEALDLIQPPTADADGGASLAHELTVPPGRAGVAPDLALAYDSAGGSSWVGTGWDLSVGAVTVDTEYGAPRYLGAVESETYALDGDRLFPNAIRTVLEPRAAGPRSDWVRQTEDDHDLITRHGSSPSSYCWEVADTMGNHRFYGGTPDGNGGCTRDETAILTADPTGAPGGVAGDFHWALRYVVDISGNTMEFHYDEVEGVAVGREGPAIGVSLYLLDITYTGFNDDALDRPAYRVTFLRDADVDDPADPDDILPRSDVTVDAGSGLPVVTGDLLREVKVEYLSEAFYDSAAPATTVKGWTLQYDVSGPFDKSLLVAVGQYGTGGAGTEHAWHEFTWFDDIHDSNGDYAGFGPAEQWGSGQEANKVNIAAESALGTSWRAGGDGGAYIGFNPIAPSKIGSFGGSFNIAGGQSQEVSTLLDLNGDGLPDKVYVEGGSVLWRPNLRRPGTTDADKFTDGSWFGVAQPVKLIEHTAPGTTKNLNQLGVSSDLKIDVHFEAYPVVAIQVGGGFAFAFGDRYFEDVNGDGRVDLIGTGEAGAHTVFYNVLVGGVPTFVDSSLATLLSTVLEVPLDEFDPNSTDGAVAEVAELLVNTSPRIDTVRRWIAPHDGTVRVTGTVALTEGAGYEGDGAQVSIEHDGAQEFITVLDANQASATHDTVIEVDPGQALFFRVHVIENAAGDQVTWNPTITYVENDGITPVVADLDANGRSQVVFTASQDFTLFGRTGARTALTEPGPLTITVDVDLLDELSDDLEVVVVHGRGDDDAPDTYVPTPVVDPEGDLTVTQAITVTAPETVDPDPLEDGDEYEVNDWIEVEVRSDSPVDPTKFSIDISTTSPGATPPDLSQIPTDADVDIPLEIPIVPNVPVFARTDHAAPYEPVRSPNMETSGTSTVHVEVGGDASAFFLQSLASPAVLTLKTLDDAVVARAEFIVANQGLAWTGAADLQFTPVSDTDYYIDVSVADPVIGGAVDLTTSTVTFNWSQTEQDGDGNDTTVDHSSEVQNAGQLHWPDVDGIFPSGNRGWALAGYNADHALAEGGQRIVETQFQFKAATADGSYDEDTQVPEAGDAPAPGDITGDIQNRFDPSYPYIPWGESGSDIATMWRAGEKATLNGTGTTMQSDRLGADVAIAGLPADGRRAPQQLSVSGDFNFMLGLIFSFTAAAGGGRALTDYEDYNGDGYPDWRNGSSVDYTGPRGGNALSNTSGENPFDLSLALGGGINGSAISVSSSSTKQNSDGGGMGSNVEPTSTKSSRGMNLGLGFSVQSQWENPTSTGNGFGSEIAGGGSDAPDLLGPATSASGTQVDRAHIDMNGDGLPDRVDSYTSGELWVSFNLGYRFAQAIQWAEGRTAANQDLAGSLSVGFQLNAYEFGGGIVYNEGVGFSQFDWIDIDGDGVPDSMDSTGDDDPTTIFGSADGMERQEITYGTFPVGEVALDAHLEGNEIDLPGGQTEVSRSTGLAGGVDFSIYIGPICVVACYIVINPGAHGGYDRQTSQIQMTDMNGDGFTDAVKSTDYQDVAVRLNQRRRTNMLQSVTNPLGGQIRLDYERTGNTVANPESVWVMSRVEFDDGRAGDGPDVQTSRFSYSGDRWDPLLREQLGFTTVVEEQLDADGDVVRSYERTYLNGNPSESGTLVEEKLFDHSVAPPRLAQRSTFQWEFVNANPHGAVAGGPNVAYGDPVTNLPEVGTPARVLLFDTALSPRLVTDTVVQFDAFDADEQMLRTHYTYNAIGDVLTVWETNEHEIEGDDTYTVLTYPECAARDGARQLGPDDSWVSVPQTVTVYAGKGSDQRLKHRDGGPDLCANSVPVRLAELVAEDPVCGDLYAITEVSFDTWGNYNAVAWPSNEIPADCADYPPATIESDDLSFEGCSTLGVDDATRYCVDYVYDDHRHTDVSIVTDNHGVSAEATYEPRNGRLATRDDAAGNTTSYRYDAAGRLASVTAPREQGTGTETMTYAYGALDATLNPNGAHAWATTSIHDVFNSGNRIDTVTFVDGMGRVVQRKRDAQVDGVPGEARIVEGAVEFDALGRALKEWYPVVEPMTGHALATYNTNTSETGAAANVPVTKPIVRTYDVFDRMRTQTLPDLSLESVRYEFELLPQYDGDITMAKVTTTDPLGRAISQWVDVGGAVFRNEDVAAAANFTSGDPLAALPSASQVLVEKRIRLSPTTEPTITTRYDYDRLGRLVTVIDAAQAQTAHTYDFLDNVTSTDTPDGGLVQRTFAPSGQLLTVERAEGTLATSHYDRDRLIETSYSDDTPAVTYEWGDEGEAENGAGRVIGVVDGAMERTYGYDGAGNVSRETATEDDAPFGISIGTPRTFTTSWLYDSLGRVELLTYPDGEELTHDYDLGGRPSRLEAQAPQHDLYDQYGVAVPRPDVEIVYVDEVRYDQFGEATYLRTGTGVETRYEYEPARRFLATIDTDSTAAIQYDGAMSTARPLQRLEYDYDAVGNIRDVVNRLYETPTDTAVTQLGPPPVNNVPGPSQHAYTYDGHYRLTDAAATYVDQKENRQYTYQSDYDDNGNLASLRQVTTTTSTTTTNNPQRGDSGNGKKGNGSGTSGTTGEPTCESNTGSGGGSFNQDPETTYVMSPGDLEYAVDGAGNSIHQLVRAGSRTYTYDDNGNQTGWVHPCASSTGGSSTISRTFEWDAENRVTRIAEGNNDTDYRYSAEGARAMERGPGGRTWFVNEHWRTVNDGHRYASIFLGGQMVASHRTSSADPAPSPCTDTDVTTCTCDSGTACRVVDVSMCDLATRVFDAATSTCQPMEDRTIHFLHKDLQGSLRVATDEVGTVFQYVDYLANGRPWVAGQSTIQDTPYLFAGGWTDTTYDLVNFGDRWYEPREQGFLSTEPLLEDNPYAAVSDPAVLSAYTYASSNPLRYVDPDGRASKTAYNGYDLGAKFENHQKGNITISVARRDARKAPAITFGGRYSNDLNGQDLQQSFQDHKDKADRASTVLTINIEDGERKVYIFGNKVDDTSAGDQAAPSPSPTSSGAATDAGPPQSAPQQPGSPTQPTADDASSQGAPTSGQGGSTGAAAGGGGAAQPPPQASGDGGAGAGNDAPSTQQQPPPQPNAGSGAAGGADPTP